MDFTIIHENFNDNTFFLKNKSFICIQIKESEEFKINIVYLKNNIEDFSYEFILSKILPKYKININIFKDYNDFEIINAIFFIINKIYNESYKIEIFNNNYLFINKDKILIKINELELK